MRCRRLSLAELAPGTGVEYPDTGAEGGIAVALASAPGTGVEYPDTGAEAGSAVALASALDSVCSTVVIGSGKR